MKNEQVHELLYQALETEAGGKQIYTKAVECASTPELQEEWEKDVIAGKMPDLG